MFRFLLAAVAALFCPASPRGGAAEPAAAAARVVHDLLPPRNRRSLDQFEENPAVTRRMVDRLVRAATGQPDTAAAWRSLVTPTDRVGIKISAAGGRYFASHHGIVEAIVEGLEQAGVPRNRIIVWDREADDLRAAGYASQRGGYDVASVPPRHRLRSHGRLHRAGARQAHLGRCALCGKAGQARQAA